MVLRCGAAVLQDLAVAVADAAADAYLAEAGVIKGGKILLSTLAQGPKGCTTPMGCRSQNPVISGIPRCGRCSMATDSRASGQSFYGNPIIPSPRII